jgi:endoglycosylceramidase
MRRTRRLAAGAIAAAVGLLPVLGGPSARASSRGGDARGGDARGGPLPWLHVAHPAGGVPVIADPNGRTVVLRGVNATGFEDDWYRAPGGAQPVQPFWPELTAPYNHRCPVNSHLVSEPPLCEVDAGRPEFDQSAAAGSQNDLAQMRALGFNVIRLTLNWSLLEPTPGRYRADYLDRVAQVVDWAGEQHIYVLLDMHQDNYSRFIPTTAPVQVPPLLTTTPESGGHGDGAPPWAIVADGVPSLGLLGHPEFNSYVAAAYNSFWLNRSVAVPQGDAPGKGLQDHFIGAMAALARRFKDNPTVAGYEIMNEPLPGTSVAPGLFDQGLLYPFYRRVIDAVTGARDGLACPPSTPAVAACGYPDLGVHDRRHAFFFEPVAIRNLVDVAPQISVPFSSYPNLVYAPHAYTHVLSFESYVPGGVGHLVPYPLSYDQALQTATLEARLMGAALFIGEYGDSSNDDAKYLAPETAAIDRGLAGSAVWAWKGNCNPGDNARQCAGTWATYDGDPASPPVQNLGVKASRVKYLSRVYPQATQGTLLAFGYDPSSRTFTMRARYTGRRIKPSDASHETVVYVPPGVSGTAGVGGSAVIDRVIVQPDGSRLVLVAPRGGGEYHVSVG